MRDHASRGFPAGQEAPVTRHLPDFPEHALRRIENRKIDVGTDVEDANLQRRVLVGCIQERRNGFFRTRVESVPGELAASSLDFGLQGRQLFSLPPTAVNSEPCRCKAPGDGGANKITRADDCDTRWGRHAHLHSSALLRLIGLETRRCQWQTSGMKWNELLNENCSLARSLAVIGDRWTLLILRDAFLRVRRFDDFQERLGIARRVLAERLAVLVEHGVFEKTAYQERPTRYEYRLTKKGLGLYPIILSLVHWGDEHYAGEEGPPVHHRHKRAC